MTMKLGSAAGANYTDNTWTNQSVYLAPVNGTDGESGHSTTTYVVSGANTVASTSAANTLVNAGTSTVTVTTTDVSGNIATRTYTVKIDKTNPIAGTMIMKLGSAAGANYTDNTWTNQSVYLLPVNGTDSESGHSTTTYAVSGANAVAAGTTAASTLVNAGTSNITATTTDNVGNTATRTYTVKIDKTLPTAGTMIMKLGSSTGLPYADNTWTNQSVYLQPVNGSDGESGHSTTTYTVSGANTVASTNAASTIVNAGTSTITLTSTDLAGNVSATRAYTVKIDKTLPTVVFGTNGGTNATSASSTATVSDSGGSGLNTGTLQYVWSTSTTEPANGWNTFSNGQNLTSSTVGNIYLWVKAYDVAGNYIATKTTSYFTVYSPTPPPTPIITPSTTAWTKNVNITITYPGTTTARLYSYDNANWNNYYSIFSVTNNYTMIYAKSYNSATGLYSNVSTLYITNIDTTAPTISFGTNGGSNLTSASSSVTVSDGQSGAKSNQEYVWSTSTTTPTSGWLSFTNTSSPPARTTVGTCYLWVRGTDNAGNYSTSRSNSFSIIAPLAPLPTISVTPHISMVGWLSQVTGTAGQAVTCGRGYCSYYNQNGYSNWGPLKLEAFRMRLLNNTTGVTASINCHVSNTGWQGYYAADGSHQFGQAGINSNPATAPIWGIEAVQMTLSSYTDFDIAYRVFMPTITAGGAWSEWYKNGVISGTIGRSLAISAIDVKIIRKGQTP